MPRQKVAEKGPKITPLAGYLRTQYVKCGRFNCHCRSGDGHGPYSYRIVRTNGNKRKQYVRKADLSMVRAGIDRYRRQKEAVREMNQEAWDNWRELKSRLRQLDQLMRGTET